MIASKRGLLSILFFIPVAAGGTSLRLSNPRVRVEASVDDGRLTEEYFVRNSWRWKPILRYEGPRVRLPCFRKAEVLFDFEKASRYYGRRCSVQAAQLGQGKTVRIRRGPAAVNGDESRESHCSGNAR